MQKITITLKNENCLLLAEKALFWQRTATLLIADAHFGKCATFRQAGIPIPHSSTEYDLQQLTKLINQYSVKRIIFLGDLLHHRAAQLKATMDCLKTWRELHKNITMLLIRGNHDKHAGDPPDYLKIDCVNEPYHEAPFAFCHDPTISASGYVLAGHVHPVIKLQGYAKQSLRLPCFYFAKNYGILPAFGNFTGGFTINPSNESKLFAIYESQITKIVY